MTFSVIIPSTRPKLLAELLDSLRAQIFDRPFEIIVVDDRPTADPNDPPFDSSRFDCRLLRAGGGGPARARNLGAACATGAYLLFLDDDVRVDRRYLAGMLKEIEARPDGAVCGFQIATDRRNSFSLASEWMLHLFVEEEGSKFAASNGLAMRRADFERCGGFDPYFPLPAGEDREFCARWIAAGFHIVLVRAASIHHHFPQSFVSLAKQQWRYGRGAFHCAERMPRHLAPRIRDVRFYLRMCSEAPKRYGLMRGALVGLLCWISQGILAGGYLRERIWTSAVPREEMAAVEQERISAPVEQERVP